MSCLLISQPWAIIRGKCMPIAFLSPQQLLTANTPHSAVLTSIIHYRGYELHIEWLNHWHWKSWGAHELADRYPASERSLTSGRIRKKPSSLLHPTFDEPCSRFWVVRESDFLLNIGRRNLHRTLLGVVLGPVRRCNPLHAGGPEELCSSWCTIASEKYIVWRKSNGSLLRYYVYILIRDAIAYVPRQGGGREHFDGLSDLVAYQYIVRSKVLFNCLNFGWSTPWWK